VIVRRIRNACPQFTALLLLALWLPISTHEWLESSGLIHTAEHCEHDAAHEAADGSLLASNDPFVLKPVNVIVAVLSPAFDDLLAMTALSTEWEPPLKFGHSTAPPGLSATWQFSARAALPGRDPAHV
jgi:hypothetical protein